MHAEERQHECSQRRSEVRAGRLSSRFRLRAYRTVQTRPVSSRSVHHGIFPDVYFYTHSRQRPHERRPMASRREQVSALFSIAWTQRRLTECFPWATEGPNPPKETLTFKKEFFWQTTSGSLPAGLNSTKRGAFFSTFCVSKVITTAHAHKSGVIFHIFPRSFQTTKKKIKELQPKMTKIASGGPALKVGVWGNYCGSMTRPVSLENYERNLALAEACLEIASNPVCITTLHPKLNGSLWDLPSSSIQKNDCTASGWQLQRVALGKKGSNLFRL